ALFNERGLSYSPLYPVLLAPIYALGAAAPTAYSAIKSVNAVLISLSVFPTYAIARYVLSRRLSLLVVALATAAPLMAYTSYVMSENLAYPVCLVAIWRMIEAVRRPGVRNEVLLMGALLLAAAARTQLVALVPAALTAVVLTAALEREPRKLSRRLANAVRLHWILLGAVAGALLVAAVAGLAGQGVFSVFGRYAVVFRDGAPNFWHFAYVLAQHAAGIDLAVGVVP